MVFIISLVYIIHNQKIHQQVQRGPNLYYAFWNYFTLYCITSLPCCLIEELTHLKVKQGLDFCNSLLSIGAGEKMLRGRRMKEKIKPRI